MQTLPLGVSPREGLSALGAGLVGALAFPPVGLWLLLPVSIALLLFILRKQGPRDARNLGVVYGFFFGFGTMYWLFGLFGFLAICLIGLMAAYFGLLGTLIGLSRGHAPLVRAAVVALFALAVEWLRGDAWYLRFPWYTMPHALAAQPAWIAPVRWIGTCGLSGFLWLIISWGVFSRPWFWLLILLVPASSFLLPAVSPPDRRALLLQAEESYELDKLIGKMQAEKVDMAVLPEYAYHTSPERALAEKHGPATLARRLSCPVVFGAVEPVPGSDKYYNVAVVINADGKIIDTFPKQRPLPLFADGLPGDRRPVFQLDQGTLGVAVCYDFDFPEVPGALVRSGATVLVAPTFDAITWGRIEHVHHEYLLRLRAVENDRWIVRPASSGRSEAVNPHGVPSEEGLAIGETGTVVVAYGHRDGIPWGGQTGFLGPVSAALGLLVLVYYAIGHWKMRSQTPLLDKETEGSDK